VGLQRVKRSRDGLKQQLRYSNLYARAVYCDHISPQHGPPATCSFVVPIVSLREPHTMIRAGSFETIVGLLHAPAVGRASMTAIRPVKRRTEARLRIIGLANEVWWDGWL